MKPVTKEEALEALMELIIAPCFTGALFEKDPDSHRAWTLAREVVMRADQEDEPEESELGPAYWAVVHKRLEHDIDFQPDPEYSPEAVRCVENGAWVRTWTWVDEGDLPETPQGRAFLEKLYAQEHERLEWDRLSPEEKALARGMERQGVVEIYRYVTFTGMGRLEFLEGERP